jgi:hypothetical protein
MDPERRFGESSEGVDANGSHIGKHPRQTRTMKQRRARVALARLVARKPSIPNSLVEGFDVLSNALRRELKRLFQNRWHASTPKRLIANLVFSAKIVFLNQMIFGMADAELRLLSSLCRMGCHFVSGALIEMTTDIPHQKNGPTKGLSQALKGHVTASS